MRKITITCDDDAPEFTSVERENINDLLSDYFGFTNIEVKIEQEAVK
jgi:hypothetical protein